MVNILRINPNHGRDFHPLADQLTKVRNFKKGEIREFTTFPFSLQLNIFNQRLSNVMVWLLI